MVNAPKKSNVEQICFMVNAPKKSIVEQVLWKMSQTKILLETTHRKRTLLEIIKKGHLL